MATTRFFPYLIFIFVFFGCVDTSNLSRVAQSRIEKGPWFDNLLQSNGLDTLSMQLFLRAFKKEERLEVWAAANDTSRFQLLITYPFCKSSGQLGPKRKEGDRQIPEGFYHIDRMNPRSKFFLSMGLNYPNESDKILSDPRRPGSDIFIHGACATVGCIPITDEKIKELYLLVLPIWNRRVRIPVHIFPTQLNQGALQKLRSENPTHLDFWMNLQPGYLHFEKHRKLNTVSIGLNGAYQY